MTERTLRILLVEDDADDHLIIRNLLHGFSAREISLEWVRDAESARRALANGQFDVCLIDYRLGLEDGLEIIRRQGQDPQAPPMILLTGVDEHDIDIKALRYGASDYLVKAELTKEHLERSIRYAIEHRRIQRALKQSERHYRGIIDASLNAIVAMDVAGRIIEWNPQAEAIFGWSRIEVLGEDLADTIIPPQHRQAHRNGFQRFERIGQPQILGRHLVLTALRRDGSEFPVEVAITAVPEKDTLTFVGFITDLTEEKRSQTRLKAINDCLLNLQADPDANIRSLTQLCGRLMEAACAMYSRLDHNLLCAVGEWQTPAEFEPVSRAEGRICNDVIQQASDRLFVVRNLQQSPYVNTDPNIGKYNLQTYLGKAVRRGDRAIGVLSVMYQSDMIPSEGDAEVIGIIATAIGVEEERRAAANALSRNERRYRHLYEENPAMFLTLAPDGTILSINAFGAVQLGYKSHELIGKSIGDLVYEEDRAACWQILRDTIGAHGGVSSAELRNVRKDGSILWVRQNARVTMGEDGRPVILSVCEDISKAHELSEQLSYQATHDALTGFVNRHEFERRLSNALAGARQHDAEHALCYLDLDQFKIINDTCGHIAGDALLRQLGVLLNSKIRKRDTLARLGGDEFGILIEHCSLSQAQRIAESLLGAIREFRFAWADKRFTVGASIGLVPINANSQNVSELLRMADTACYMAKEAGRNSIRIYEPTDSQVARHHGEMAWVERLYRALEDNRLKLAFQNIVPIACESVGLHFELLLRMNDEQGNIVLPSTFLPAAERFSFIDRLDRWVVGAAFHWFRTHPEALDQLTLCSINLSGRSLGNEELADYILKNTAGSGLPPTKFCFEVTETAAIANFSAAVQFMQKLREEGFRFALDDFGSGLSSFAYLRTLPVDFVKIDGLFVKDIDSNPIDRAMVHSINEIAHVMGKKTVAEYVENHSGLTHLRHIGVDYAQGHAINPPQPLDDLLVIAN
jgi:diguanylate cyclase (GGDEF)-like protein/PAS domain S-box-containing protein